MEKIDINKIGWVIYKDDETGGISEFSQHLAIKELAEKINEIIDELNNICTCSSSMKICKNCLQKKELLNNNK